MRSRQIQLREIPTELCFSVLERQCKCNLESWNVNKRQNTFRKNFGLHIFIYTSSERIHFFISTSSECTLFLNPPWHIYTSLIYEYPRDCVSRTEVSGWHEPKSLILKNGVLFIIHISKDVFCKYMLITTVIHCYTPARFGKYLADHSVWRSLQVHFTHPVRIRLVFSTLYFVDSMGEEIQGVIISRKCAVFEYDKCACTSHQQTSQKCMPCKTHAGKCLNNLISSESPRNDRAGIPLKQDCYSCHSVVSTHPLNEICCDSISRHVVEEVCVTMTILGNSEI